MAYIELVIVISIAPVVLADGALEPRSACGHRSSICAACIEWSPAWIVLAMFSFVGFESRLRWRRKPEIPGTIPRAVLQSALLAGLFFITPSYTRWSPRLRGNTDQSDIAHGALSRLRGAPRLGPLIDIGAMISMFACVLACVTAAARVLLMMSHNA